MSHSRPVFYDPEEVRWRKTLRWTTLGGGLLALLLTCFVLGLFVSPLLEGSKILHRLKPTERNAPHMSLRQGALAAAQKQQLLHEIAAEHARRHAQVSAATQQRQHPGIVCGFYVNYEDTGITSLENHVDQLTHLCPQWLFLQADGQGINTDAADPHKEPVVRDVLRVCYRHHLPIVPMLSNYDNGWQAARLHTLLSHPERHRPFAQQLRKLLQERNWQGVNLDLETIAASDRDHLTHLVGEIYRELHPAGLLVCQDVQAAALDDLEDYAFDLKALARVNDFVVYMAYDQHEEEHEAGPICGIDWFRRQWAYATSKVPADRLVLALGNYAYDWTLGRTPADDLTYQAALNRCADNHDGESPRQVITLDPTSLNPYYDYEDEAGKAHRVWMMDATVAANAWTVAQEDEPRGVALWFLGSEDPSVWTFVDHTRLTRPVDAAALEQIQYPYEIDYQGAGEILEVKAAPKEGVRHLTQDKETGLITGSVYESFPSSYVIERRGKQETMLALTFDDGPDGQYTAPILDVLKELHAPATFFDVGDNVERYPDLVRRTWDEGHELGNHTFFHPNLAHASEQRVQLEVNATQRALEALTGHSTLEFRAPYSADAEPRTADEVRPLVLVGDQRKLGDHAYLAIGESIDPKDWDPFARDALNQIRTDAQGQPIHRTAQTIADYTITEALAHHGNIILLHDAGGDRSQTVQALPRIVKELRSHGFRFVTVSELLNKPARALNPPVAAADVVVVGFEGFWMRAVFAGQKLLYYAFFLAIIIGVARVAIMLALALIEVLRRPPEPGPDFRPLVSVVIAAYNEEKVVNRTIETVLASEYDHLQVVVVDDGSKDRTWEVLQQAYGSDERVTLVQQANGGKASALNNGLTYARGEIIVSLDADTLFERATIGRMVRHFVDPRMGAVAGNVKVGNRLNTITRWQSIEYITSQNLDRRAYSLLNAITVIPGAVGAWRREAIAEAGGYTSDTLAEDTDLTWKIRRRGWKLATDTGALAWTEAPDTLSAFFKQRFRWTYGILQALFKHRDALFRHGWFGWVALPFLWVYQFVFQVLSPLIDLQIVAALLGVAWAGLVSSSSEIAWSELARRDLGQIAFYYALFFVVELVGALFAFALDGENPLVLVWLFVQRFVYRQLMYAVVFRTLLQALRGRATGWGKLERKNTATAPGA